MFSTGLISLKENLAAYGIEFDIASSASIQASLLRIRAQCDKDLAQVKTTSPRRGTDGRELSFELEPLTVISVVVCRTCCVG